MFGRTYPATASQPERRYYQCHGKDCVLTARPARCPSRNVKAKEIEAVVWDHVAGLLADPARLVAQFARFAAVEAGSDRERAADQLLRTRMERTNRADKRLLDAYEAGVISLAEMSERRHRLAEERRALDRQQQERARLRQQRAQAEAVRTSLEAFCTRVGSRLEDASLADRQAILQLVIERIIVGDGSLEIRHVIPLSSGQPSGSGVHTPQPQSRSDGVHDPQCSCPGNPRRITFIEAMPVLFLTEQDISGRNVLGGVTMVCGSATYESLQEAQRRWNNWPGTVDYVADQFFEPSHSSIDGPSDGLQQLVHVVRLATEGRKRLHVAGSGWAYEEIAKTDAWLISLAQLSRRLDYVVGPNGALTDEWRLRIQDPAATARLVHVEAGITIASLNERLAEMNLSMPTLGGANAQSLAGAISTSTHGGDLDQPPLPDLVRAVHLVAEGGRELWIERQSAPVTDADRLLTVLPCPDTEIIRDDKVFEAATVSVGRFGVIYAFMLEARTEFRLVEVVSEPQADAVITALRDGQDAGDPFGPLLALLSETPPPGALVEADGVLVQNPPHFLQLAFNPKGTDRCWATRRWETTEAEDLLPGGGYGLTGPAVYALAATAFSAGAFAALGIPVVGPYYSFRLTLAANEMNRLAAQDAGETSQGVAAATALNLAYDMPFVGESIPTITDMIVHGRFAGAIKSGRRGPSHIITSGRPEDSQDIPYRGDYIEMVFDAHQSGFIDFLELILRSGRGFRQAGYLSLRPSLRSAASLSMHNVDGARAVSVEVTSLKDLRDNLVWMTFLQEQGIRLGGRPHWGQFNRLAPQETLALYGEKLNAWREALVRVSGTSRTFSNAFCRNRGLEPTEIVREITAVRRNRGDVTHLCGSEGSPWSPVSVKEAIVQIRGGVVTYLARFGEYRVVIRVVRHPKGGYYLRTAADAAEENNLDELPECDA